MPTVVDVIAGEGCTPDPSQAGVAYNTLVNGYPQYMYTVTSRGLVVMYFPAYTKYAVNLALTPGGSYFWVKSDGNNTNPFGTYTADPGTGAAGVLYVTDPLANRTPSAIPLAVTIYQNVPEHITLSGTDPDGDALTFTVVSGPSHGTLSGAAPALVYTPETGYVGTDSFSYRVNDGTTDSDPVLVTISIITSDDTPLTVALSTPELAPDQRTVTVTPTITLPVERISSAVVEWGDGASSPAADGEPLQHTYSDYGRQTVALLVITMDGGVQTTATVPVLLPTYAPAIMTEEVQTMTYKHGITVSEVPTSIQPPVTTVAGLPVILGATPVHHVDGGTGNAVNTPVLCNTFDEFVAKLGYSDDWTLYPGCEAAYLFFRLARVAPVVFINPLDPTTQGTPATTTAPLVAGSYTLAVDEVVLASLVVKSADGVTTYEKGTHYDAIYDEDWHIVITRIGTTLPTTASLKYEYAVVDGTALEAADLVTAIGAVEQVYPKTQQVPGQLLAPGWSDTVTVGAALVGAAKSINGAFRAMALCDIPATVTTKEDAVAWVQTHSYTDPQQINCWPLVTLGEKTFHLSTQVAAANSVLDAANGDVPVASPSNQKLWTDGTVLANGTPIWLTNATANTLEAGGVVTAINWARGWVAWGNRTGAYPGSTDPKDTFIPVRRMFNWEGNTLVITYWQDLDLPLNPRFIETMITSINQWLNGQRNRGYILGGSAAFNRSENPTTDVLDGSIVVHILASPPPPARAIDFVLEYDVAALATLFA